MVENEKEKNIRGLILDMDGVLWRGPLEIGNLRYIFEDLSNRGLQVVLASNNPTKTVEQVLDKLEGFQVKLDPWQIITSAVVTAEYLKSRYPEGGSVYIVGENGLIDTLEQYGFYHKNNSQVISVVVGMDRRCTYDELKLASILVRSGVPFIGTNPDRTYPTPEGLAPGAGSLLAFIEAASDRSPMIMGKPETKIFDTCLHRMNLKPEQVLAVGDRLETDISTGQKLGLYTGLVLSGVSNKKQANNWRPRITYIADDLTQLLKKIF